MNLPVICSLDSDYRLAFSRWYGKPVIQKPYFGVLYISNFILKCIPAERTKLHTPEEVQLR